VRAENWRISAARDNISTQWKLASANLRLHIVMLGISIVDRSIG